MDCTHHASPSRQGTSAPEGTAVHRGAVTSLPPSESADTGWVDGGTVAPPPVPACTTHMPWESYCWQAAGAPVAIDMSRATRQTVRAVTISPAATRRTTEPGCWALH